VDWRIYLSICQTVDDVVCGVRGPTTQHMDSRLQTKIVINPLDESMNKESMNKES